MTSSIPMRNLPMGGVACWHRERHRVYVITRANNERAVVKCEPWSEAPPAGALLQVMSVDKRYPGLEIDLEVVEEARGQVLCAWTRVVSHRGLQGLQQALDQIVGLSMVIPQSMVRRLHDKPTLVYVGATGDIEVGGPSAPHQRLRTTSSTRIPTLARQRTQSQTGMTPLPRRPSQTGVQAPRPPRARSDTPVAARRDSQSQIPTARPRQPTPASRQQAYPASAHPEAPVEAPVYGTPPPPKEGGFESPQDRYTVPAAHRLQRARQHSDQHRVPKGPLLYRCERSRGTLYYRGIPVPMECVAVGEDALRVIVPKQAAPPDGSDVKLELPADPVAEHQLALAGEALRVDETPQHVMLQVSLGPPVGDAATFYVGLVDHWRGIAEGRGT